MLPDGRTFLVASVIAFQVVRVHGQSTTRITSLQTTGCSGGAGAQALGTPSITASVASTVRVALAGALTNADDEICFHATSCASCGTTIALGSAHSSPPAGGSCTNAGGNNYDCPVTIATAGAAILSCYQEVGFAFTKQDDGAGTDITIAVVAATSTSAINAVTPAGLQASQAKSILFNMAGGGAYGVVDLYTGTCGVGMTWTCFSAGANPTESVTIASAGQYKVCYQAAGGTDAADQGLTFLVTPVFGSGADPVAWAGDKVRVFELPVGALVPLLQTTDMTLRGATFSHGGPWQQWFGRMVLSCPDRSHWVEISMKKDILHFNRSRAPRSHFETLEVSMGIGAVHDPALRTPIQDITTKIPSSFLGFEVHFWKMDRNAQAAHTKIGAARRECMEVAGANAHFFVCSSPAHEFYGWQYNMSVENAHLDLVMVQIHNWEELRGLFPELWGLHPMSNETRKYIVHDSFNDSSNGHSNLSVNSTELPKLPEGFLQKGQAWAGGFNPEESLRSCKGGNGTALSCRNELGEQNPKILSI